MKGSTHKNGASQAARDAASRVQMLVISRNFPPLRGGMERLNLHLVQELAAGGALTVVGPKGCATFMPPGVTTVEIPLRPLWRFLVGALWNALGIALRQRPRWIVAGSGLTAPIAVVAAFVTRSRAAVYVHGLDLVVPHRLYQQIWIPFIRHCNICIVNSANTQAIAIAHGVDETRTRIVYPGVNIPAGTTAIARRSFTRRMGWDGRRVMLSVGRLTVRKGLLEFIEHSMHTIIASFPTVLLVIVGDDAPDALAPGKRGVRESIIEAVERLGLSGHVALAGSWDDDDLDLAYDSADVYVFPIREVEGDVEGFGMVAIEAAAHGLATVAFASGGVPDAVADGLSGYLIPVGDYVAFADRVCLALGHGRCSLASTATQFANGFVWPVFGERLRSALVLHDEP